MKLLIPLLTGLATVSAIEQAPLKESPLKQTPLKDAAEVISAEVKQLWDEVVGVPMK